MTEDIRLKKVVTEEEEVAIRDGLRALACVQRRVNAGTTWFDESPTDEELKDFIRTFAYALTVEVGELSSELGWKPWKNHSTVSPDRVADEFADVLAFLGMFVFYLDRREGIDSGALAQAYTSKSSINHARLRGQVKSYGVGKKYLQ